MLLAPTSKAEFLRRYMAGEFGNRLRTWNTWAELATSGYTGLVSARNREAAGSFQYGKTMAELEQLCQPLSDFHFNETPPDDLLVLQGEISETHFGLSLTYSTTPGLSMRQALAEPAKEVYGLRAVGLLRMHLRPASYDDLMDLLERYSDGVVEFSAYAKPVGCFPCRNAVFWEVRNY